MTILIAEDDEDDFFFTARELGKATSAPLMHVESGRGAIDYLAGQGKYTDRGAFPFPDVVLLDLKMDDVDGHAVLGWVRDNPLERPLRIFALTGSGEMRDRDRVKVTVVAEGYFVKLLTAENVATILK